MLFIYLGAKLASQQQSECSNKIAHLCSIISDGIQFEKEHMTFLAQFVKQKHTKIATMADDLHQMSTGQKSSNKTTLQKQILIEK
jgi:hypothetical protein